MMPKTCISAAILLAMAITASACGPDKIPRVMDVRDVSAAGGAPEIDAITDLGNVVLPERGQMKVRLPGDGYAVIGELLLVRGSNFGKQPRITIGGRGTEVAAHVKGGGVVVRVPWGIDPGVVDLEVVHGRGRSSKKLTIKRLGLVALGQQLQLIEVLADGKVKALGPLPLTGATHVTFSYDGAAAYVGGATGKKLWLKTLDMTMPRPKVIAEDTFPGTRIISLLSAKQATMGAVVSDTHVVVFDNSRSYDAALYKPYKIAHSLKKKGVLSAAMGGRGKTLALLLADLNEVALYDTSVPSELGQLTVTALLPEQRMQVVQDLQYSPDGGSLWIVSGDTQRSAAGGFVPAQLTMLRVTPVTKKEPNIRAEVHRTWQLGQGFGPLDLAVARGEPMPPGTAIRPEPSTSTVYLSTLPSDQVRARAAGAVLDGKGAGRVMRSSLGKEGQEVLSGPWLLTSQDVVGKTQVLLALGCARVGGKLQRVLVSKRAWEKDKVTITPLGVVEAGVLKAPYALGEVRAQP